MTDLIVWLRAQLDADERVARAAQPGPWTTRDAGCSTPWTDIDAANGTVTSSYDGDVVALPDAEHIVRWDPARVLAEVEAKRSLLQCLVGLTGNGSSRLVANGEPWAIGSDDLLKLLVRPYAGRIGWREEWAV